MRDTWTNMARRLLAAVLALTMVFSLCGAAAAQTRQTPKKYVSLGDSMTNGYALKGYHSNGYLVEVPEAYPAKVAAYFGWELTHPLAYSGMRVEDLHYILEYDYVNDTYGAFQGDPANAVFPEAGSIAKAAEVYQTAIKEADVISFAVGNANFGVFLMGRINNALGLFGKDTSEDAWLNVEAAMAECDAQTKAAVMQVYDLVKSELEAQVSDSVKPLLEPILEAVSYTVISYLLNYKGAIDRIVELNPDVEIMLVSMMNEFSGMKIRYQGEVLDLAAAFSKAIQPLNTYISGLPAVRQDAGDYPEATFYYMEAKEISMLIEDFDDPEKIDFSTFRDRARKEVTADIFPILNGDQDPAPYISFTNEELAAYEQFSLTEFAAYVNQNPRKAQSMALYQAVEAAVIESSNLEIIDADSVLQTLQGDLNAALENIRKQIESNLADPAFGDNAAIQAALNDAFAEAVQAGEMTQEALRQLYILKAMPEAIKAGVCSNESLTVLLHAYGRSVIGNAMGGHPNAEGHQMLTDAFIKAYESGTTAKDAATEKVTEAINDLVKLLQELGPDGAKRAWQYVLENSMGEEYAKATTICYAPAQSNYYVALGDYSAQANSYAELIAQEKTIPVKNLASGDLTCADMEAVLEENLEEIRKADLITLGFGAKTFISFTANQVKQAMLPGQTPEELDWSLMLQEDGVALVEQILKELNTNFEEILGKNYAPVMTLAVESYAYSFLHHTMSYASAVDAIHSANPEAQVVLVGMHNPMKDMTIVMEENELELGKYLDYLVELSNAYSLGYAMMTENTIYVDAPDVEVGNDQIQMDMEQFIVILMLNLDRFEPTAKGQQYVADQILKAMVDHIHSYEYGVCSGCGEENPDASLYRIWGSGRVETSLGIADALKRVKGVSRFDNILVASARNYPDALAGSYMAIRMDAPILLVENNAASMEKISAYIRQNLRAGGKVSILGGEAAVSTELDAALTAAGIASQRVAGDNRVETNLEILNKAGFDDTQKILVCNAWNYADSLAASAAGLPILLVGQELTESQKIFLSGTSGEFVIVGGTKAVNETVEAELKAMGSVTRLAGAERMETSVLVAKTLIPDPKAAVLAYSHEYPDGLCGGPLAYALKGALVLTNNGKPEAADSYVENIKTGVVLGGLARISDETVKDIFDAENTAILPREYK